MAENARPAAANAHAPAASSSSPSAKKREAEGAAADEPAAKKTYTLSERLKYLKETYGPAFAEVIFGEAQDRLMKREGCVLFCGKDLKTMPEVLADEAFMASLGERAAAEAAKAEAAEAEAAAEQKAADDRRGFSGPPTAEKYAELARKDPARVRGLCLANGLIPDGTPEEIGRRIMQPRQPENLLPKTVTGVPPAPGNMTVEEVRAALNAIGVRLEKVRSKCTLLAIQRRIIKVPAPGDLRKQVPELKGKVKCIQCGRVAVVKFKALLNQADNGLYDDQYTGVVKCRCYGGGIPFYLSGLCTGQIAVTPAKFHFHCHDCSRHVCDARERHCDTCGEHFHDATGRAPCYMCNPDALD